MAPMYALASPFTFGTCGAMGMLGPTKDMCVSAYAASWAANVSYFNMTIQGIQIWTVPQDNTYNFVVAGASGGQSLTYSVAAYDASGADSTGPHK